jgi:hypothetical protein
MDDTDYFLLIGQPVHANNPDINVKFAQSSTAFYLSSTL